MARRISQFFALCLALAGAASAEFSLCKFNFGVDYQQHCTKACGYAGCSIDQSALGIPNGIDFLTMFIGNSQNGATVLAPTPLANREGQHIKLAKAMGVTPVWYAYIIAEGAKASGNLVDCNVGDKGAGTLCTKGAAYIRANRSTIISQYTAYAQYAATAKGLAANAWGTVKPMIILVEPDFYQYTASTQSNPLSFSEAKSLLTDIAAAVKAVLPNAWLAMDISPWANSGWWSSAIPYSSFKFMGTSGGVASPDAAIKDGYTWASMWANSGGLGMISDDGYGAGGAVTSPNSGWVDVNKLNARIADGVVANWRAIGDDSWASQFTAIRSQLKELKNCQAQPTYSQFSLTLQPVTGGSVSVNPSQNLYDSGTSIKLTATPYSGYSFVSWGGDVTGTSTTATLVIKKNSTVTATFAKNGVPKYTLDVQQPTSGSITVSPNQTSIDSGTTVTLTAVPPAGSLFANWAGGSLSTNNPLTFIMTGDKTIKVVWKSTGILPRTPVLPLRMVQTSQGLSVQANLQDGSIHAEVVGMDGTTEKVLQNGSVQAGNFSATYSSEGLRAGMHVVRLVNGGKEYRSIFTLVR